MNKPINLGIIGAGTVFQEMHFPALLKLKYKFYISKIFDTEKNSYRILKDKYKTLPESVFTDSCNKIFKDEQIDAVAVLSPTSAHLQYSLLALKNNKHIFIEKPVAVSQKEILKIKYESDKTKLILQIGMVLRHSGFYKKLKELIDSKKYGKVLWMQWTETRPFDPKIWRYLNPERDGDAIIHDKAIHQINLFNEFSGAKPVKVFASANQYLLNKNKFINLRAFEDEVPLKGSSFDNLMTIIQYENGVKANLMISYVSPHSRESRWIIQTEKAKIVVHPETFIPNVNNKKHSWKGNPSCIYLFSDNNNFDPPWKIPMQYPPSEKNLIYYNEYKNEPMHPGSVSQWVSFYNSVKKGIKPDCNIDLALTDNKVVEAILKSVVSQKMILID